MIIDIAPNNVLELSLFIRAVLYTIGFTMMGIWVLRGNDRVGIFEKLLGSFMILLGIANVLMSAEWLYFFFFTDATLK